MTLFNFFYSVLNARKNRRIFRYVPLLVILSILAVSAVPLRAQGSNALTDGSVVTGTISDQAKLVIYSFNANPGDLVSALVVGTTDGMNPSISLMSPSQQQLTNNDTDPFGVAGDSSARASYRTRDAGSYSLLVGGSNGQYVLRFHVRAAGSSTSLQPTVATTANILPGGVPQSFSFAASVDSPTLLTLSTVSPNFAFVAQVYDGNGQLVAALGGSTIQAADLTVGPGNDIYEVLVSALQPNMQGAVSLLVAPGSGSGTPPADQPTLVPTPDQSTLTPVPTIPSAPQAPAGVCSVTSSQPGSVNIRSGPGTNYPVISQLQPNTFMTIQGINADGTWYVNVQGGLQSWVSSIVVTVSGPCVGLPAIQPPPPPPTWTPTATDTATPVPPTATVTDTPTVTYTPSFTPDVTNTPKFVIKPDLVFIPTMQTAANDNEPHSINIGSSGALLANAVSSPNGDSSDTVKYKVTWAYVGTKTLSIAATCTGTNTQYATFSIGNTSVKCGGSFIAGVNSGAAGTLTVKTTNTSFVNYNLKFTWV